MNDTAPIALQLYSVRDAAKADLGGVLRQVAGLGYDGVEFAGFHGHDAKRVKAWLDEYGLRCPSTHTGLHELGDASFDDVVAYHRTIGCDTILVPWLPPEKRDTLAGCRETVAFFLKLLDRLAAVGMRTGFHVHAEDVVPLRPPAGDIGQALGRRRDELLPLQRPEPRHHGGQDPQAGLAIRALELLDLGVAEVREQSAPLAPGGEEAAAVGLARRGLWLDGVQALAHH
ncbi:MAG: hypothetical protein AAGL98_02850, partial [Planctomycetota bacterium]